MKELLDLLEERISGLLEERGRLQAEVARLREEIASATARTADETRSLREALSQEQAVRESAAERIDRLLARLKEQVPE